MLEALAQRVVVERRNITRAARCAFHDVQEGDALFTQLLGDVLVLRLRVAAGNAIGRGHRRDPHAGALRTDFLDHGGNDLQQQARAISHRTTVGIGAHVGAVLDELIEQITVGAVDFHTVEARFNGVCSGLAEIIDDAWQFAQFQRAWLGDVGECVIDEGFGLRPDSGWRDRCCAARLQVDVRNPANVPKLHKNAPALGMHGIGDDAPGGDLLRRIQPRRVLVALSLRGDLRGFGNDQPGRRALGVVGGSQVGRNQAGGCTVASQRRHHDAIRERQIA